MELKYIVLTIIKILISVPAVVLLLPSVQSAALMGGHIDNKSNSSLTNFTNTYEYEFDLNDSQELGSNYTYIDEEDQFTTAETKLKSAGTPPEANNRRVENDKDTDSEEIPDPSPLVVPGYNLPENIFNKGKPFYLEKDPLTGAVDFNSKTVNMEEEEYDYVDEEPSLDIYDKANIDRKDGSLHSHKPSDVNQLTPNFHDFLNLPVKYNPDKYVYPLISSSYANTKIQGNVNKFHNHKDYTVTTYKPTMSPTYYTTKSHYFNQNYKSTQYATRQTTTTTTTPKPTTSLYLTTKNMNLLNSPMNHPSFDTQYEKSTHRNKLDEIYLTTENVNNIYLTSKAPTVTTTTTKKPLSLFEQLFGGDYDDEMEMPEKPAKPPPLFSNLPSNKNRNATLDSNDSIVKDVETINNGDYQNVLSGSNMEHEGAYDYEDYSDEFASPENVTTENKPPETTKTTRPPVATETTYITSKKVIEITPVTTEISYRETTTAPSRPTQNVYRQTESFIPKTTAEGTPAPKVTSLPLGENHVTHNNRQPIIVATHNLKEQLNNEKVGKPFTFDKPLLQHAPSTSNIHIAPDQDTVSFVVGHHQSVDGGQYVGSDFKVSPYDHNPFRPLYAQPDQIIKNDVSYGLQTTPVVFNAPVQSNNEVSYTIQTKPEGFKLNQNHPKVGASSVNIQPTRNSEASLTIGVPVNSMKIVPGQVVDEKLEINNEKIEFPKSTGAKVVFPDEKEPSTVIPDLLRPPKPTAASLPNKEVLKLSSKPMFHQLPSDLTPPSEKEVILPPRLERPRPPWDPRPGHFYTGRPEYARPPRPPLGPPPTNDIYKRIDNLPNILPQFRPNMKMNAPHHYFDNMNKVHMRQPLLDRPSNKPIGFFEKLQPPPPPPKHLLNLRKIPLELRQNLPPFDYDPKLRHNLDVRTTFPQAEGDVSLKNNYPLEQNAPPKPQYPAERISVEGPKKALVTDQFPFYQTPPKVIIANRRSGEDDPEVETLQMIQAKQSEKSENKDTTASFNTNLNGKDSIEKPLYVVYPVNTPPLKLDAIDNVNKETVVIGTRAELPLPPSKIKQDISYDQNPLLNPKIRNDAPILKPHPRPPNYPIKSDFPYPIERPDQTILNESNKENKLEVFNPNKFVSSNQWNTLDDPEARIVTGSNKINGHSSNQISVTLKTFTEKPIAVAYTPTEPHHKEYTDKYSMPNYGSPVIPEIRPGLVDNAEVNHDSEFTVSAVMHTHPQADLSAQNMEHANRRKLTESNESGKLDSDTYTTHVPQIAQLDFQAPFQASINLDNMSHGWTVVRDKSKITEEPEMEATTVAVATTSEFDIENFKPQLIGGFKPLYSVPEAAPQRDSEPSERQE